MMKTEKRKANVGERILITDATGTNGQYKNGDILSVREIGVFAFFGEVGTVRVKEHSRPIYASEYEVIAPTKPKKSERIMALETQVATLQAKVEALEATVKYPNTARFERESAEIDGILADIKRKAKPKTQSPNEQRADVIKRAKAFVTRNVNDAELGDMLSVEFVINSDKRTVVAIIHGCYSKQIRAKGIAKCDPDDVFNADIGKAIALARALGVEVPVEFVKAVQPTEFAVGQVMKAYDGCVRKITEIANGKVRTDGIGFHGAKRVNEPDYAILDDTDAVYE